MESFVGLPVTHCRGADSRARRKAADQHRPALKWKWPKVCHCEGALRPWQSREGSAVSYRLPLKWHAPIASVAALSERHAGWHYWRHKFIGARPPSLSFRGAKRRGNLLQPVTFSPRPTCYPTWYCKIATSAVGLLAMTHQGGATVHQCPCAVEFIRTRRSPSADRPRRGHYHFNGSPVRIGSTQQGVEDTAPTKGRTRPINVRFLL